MLPAATLILAAQELARASGVDARRRGLAALVRAAGSVAEGDAPSPLEPLGALLSPAARAVDPVALDGLALSDAQAARGLFELGHALPRGAPRELVLASVERRMLEGPAPVFLAIARQQALSAPHELRGDPVRARLALSLAGHPARDLGERSLALALLSRRDGVHAWLTLPCARSLPERRTSALLIGRVARGLAASRASATHLRHLAELEVALRRLLGDREPLVWRHAAVARGLLAETHAPLRAEIEAALSPRATATEWRRGAASVAAALGHDPGWATALVERALADDLLARDPGVATAFTWGVAAAAERDPEGAERALSRVAERAPLAVAEALASTLAAGPGGAFAHGVVARVRVELERAQASSRRADLGVGAVLSRLIGELELGDDPVGAALSTALHAYRTAGAASAHAAGEAALGLIEARPALAALLDPTGRELGEDVVLGALRDLERGLLDDGTLLDLLSLDDKGAPATKLDALDALVTRATSAVLAREARRASRGVAPTAELPLRLQEIKALLLLADVRVVDDRAGEEGASARARRIAGASLDRLARGAPAVLERAIGAAFARAAGSLLRSGAVGVDDVLLACAWARLPPRDLVTIAEASMSPDVDAALRGLIALARADADDAPETRRHPVDAARIAAPREVVALSELALRLEAGRPPHLRGVLSRGAAQIAVVSRAATWGDLVTLDGAPAVAALEGVVAELSLCAQHAQARLGAGDPPAAPGPTPARGAFDDAVASGDQGAARSAARALVVAAAALPAPFGPIFAGALERVVTLPPGPPTASGHSPTLPSWIPADRAIGGFSVERALGEGGAGTVFVVVRTSERNDASAERFAMKLPLLSGGAIDPATLFRDEARALLDLPEHPNLARFVTFDLAARPRPALVMELVRGPSLERELRPDRMTIDRALSVLEGVSAGVAAMHGAGLAHLDLKPSNVILRDGARPVLVDYGLSGRRLRPGCASAAYGAPEVWTSEPDAGGSPLPADVYALACLAFEALTGEPLFSGGELAVLAAHLAHDGAPPRLAALGRRHEQVAALLARALCRDPSRRIDARALGAGLDALRPSLAAAAWPLSS